MFRPRVVLALATVAVVSASASARQTPPPPICGRAYTCDVAAELTVPSGTNTMLTLQTVHFMNQIGSSCPPGPYNVTITTELPCTLSPSGTLVTHGPFAIVEGGYTQIPIPVVVPAGSARHCTVMVTSTLSVVQEGSTHQQSAMKYVTVADAVGGSSPPVTISLPGAGLGVYRLHPGDTAEMDVVVNNHTSEPLNGTLTVTASNYADAPLVVPAPSDPLRGPYAPADTQYEAPAVVEWARLADACRPPPLWRENACTDSATASMGVDVLPMSSTTIKVPVRVPELATHGWAGRYQLEFEGGSGRAGPFSATSAAIVAADTTRTPTFACGIGGGRAATGLSSTLTGVGPAAELRGSARQDNGQQYRLLLAQVNSGFVMTVNGEPISSGTNFSAITQTDGQHVRLTSEYSFTVPSFLPGQVIGMTIPLRVQSHPASTAYAATLAMVGLIPGRPIGASASNPLIEGWVRLNPTGANDPVDLRFLHQFHAVGVRQGTFRLVPMTNLTAEVVHDGAGQYTLNTTWTTSDPDMTPMIGFDIFSDFRGHARPGDYDGDGIADTADAHRFRYNRDVPAPPPLTVNQINWIDDDGSPILSDSGICRLSFESLNYDSRLFLNVEANGQWAIRNQPIGGRDYPEMQTGGGQAHDALLDLGSDGVNLASGSFRWSLSHQRLSNGVPAEVPAAVTPIGDVNVINGEVSGPGAAPPTVTLRVPAAPRGATADYEEQRRPGMNQVDLDEMSETNACMPGSAATGMAWLKRTYCLELPEPDPTDFKNGILDEFERRMEYSPATGTQVAKAGNGLDAFIREHALPLVRHSWGRDVTGSVTPFNPAELYEEMRKGQIVVLAIRTGDQAFEAQGHAAVVSWMDREVFANGQTEYAVTLQDDVNQGAPAPPAGGTSSVTYRVTPGDLSVPPDGIFDGWFLVPYAGASTTRAAWKIVRWDAVSPTVAGVNRAVTLKLVALRDFIDAAGSIDTEEAQHILQEVRRIRELSDWLVNNTGASAAANLAARQLFVHAGDMLALARDLASMIGQPGQAQRAAALRTRAGQGIGKSDAVRNSFPIDDDDDDVADSGDNSVRANPDQRDCDGDGIGDVDQVRIEVLDCNDNAEVDSCDLAAGTSPDANGDGVPDECPCPADYNRSGSVSVQDIFDFLEGFFSMDPRADINGDGQRTPQDLFEFLRYFFTPCAG